MSGSGERKRGPIRLDFNRSIKVDFQGATQSSDTGFLVLREIDERFGIMEAIGEALEDKRKSRPDLGRPGRNLARHRFRLLNF